MAYSPQTWHDLPVMDTPIIAARLAYIENGIAAAHAAAATAQATADAAGGGSGDAGAIPGLVFDGTTDNGPALNDALDQAADGLRGSHLTIHGLPGQVCLIDSIVQVQGSGIILDSDVPILFGPSGKVQMFGEVVEVPASTKPKLTQDAPAGSKVLHLDVVSYFSAGDYVGLRGNRDSNGKPTQIFHSYVTAVSTGGLTVTLADELPETYLQTNITTWTNKFSQLTRVEQSRLTGAPSRGDLLVTVESTAKFAVGDVVQVISDEHTLDDGGEEQTGNYIHKEQVEVVKVASGTVLQLGHALFHDYDTAVNARVQKLRTVRNSWVQNWDWRYTSTPLVANGPWNAFEARYCYGGGFRNLTGTGTGSGGASWLTQAYRLTDCLGAYVQECRATAPDNVTGGRGYGATFYGSTLCWIDGNYFQGCRHSVLWFNGASGCLASNNLSVDARISDYDTHGADCNDNLMVNCTATGGIQGTADSDHRTAFKFGNPSHYPGDNRNTAIGCKVINYRGVAIEGIPDGAENVFKNGIIRGADVGIRLGPLTLDTDLTTGGYAVVDTDFYDVPEPFDIDGGTDDSVTKLLVENNRWHRCGPFVAANAPGLRFVGNRVMDGDATSSDFVMTLASSNGAQVKHNDFSGWPGKGVSLTGCPSARITDNDMHDMGATTVFHDGGGNAGFAFIWNRHLGYTPATTGTGSVGTLDTSNGLGSGGGGGGGGGGSYPGTYPISYTDLDSTLQTAITNAGSAYVKPGTGIPKSDLVSAVQTSLSKADAAYVKPGTGIPNADLETPGGGSADNSWDTAAEHTYAAWSHDVLENSSSSAATAGRLEITKVHIRTGGTLNNIIYSVASAATGLGGAWCAVFNSAGTQLGVTADVAAALGSTGVKKMPTTGSMAVAAGDDVYVAILQVGGTPAALHRAATSAPLVNAGLNAAAGYRFMSLSTGLTAMPGSITPSSGTSSANSYWCALD